MANDDDNESDDFQEDDLQFEIFYEKLKTKLADEAVLRRIYNAKRDIETTLGTQIVIQIPNMYEEYADDIFNALNNMGIDKHTNTMKLGFLIDYLSSENPNLKVYIDPIHLKEGLNPMSNLVLVAMDDYIILVPKNENENK